MCFFRMVDRSPGLFCLYPDTLCEARGCPRIDSLVMAEMQGVRQVAGQFIETVFILVMGAQDLQGRDAQACQGMV